MSYKQLYFCLLLLLLKGTFGLWRLGIQLWSENLLMVTLYPFVSVSTLSISSFSLTCVCSLSIYQRTIISYLSIYFAALNDPGSCILSWNLGSQRRGQPRVQLLLPSCSCQADLEQDQSHTWQHSRTSRMPADRNTSLALLEIPSRHHDMAQNPLGLLNMARLLFHLCAPNLRASAYHRNRHCLSLRAYAQSYPFLLFQSQIPCIQHSKFLCWWCF